MNLTDGLASNIRKCASKSSMTREKEHIRCNENKDRKMFGRTLIIFRSHVGKKDLL